MKDFDSWNQVKKALNKMPVDTFCKRREVWWCSIGVNIGFEQDGKHGLFERPVLVIKSYNKYVFWGVPLSTQLKPDNPHYLELDHQGLHYAAIVSQLRLYDTRRLARKLYSIDEKQFHLVIDRLRSELDHNKKSDPAFAESSEPEGIVSKSLSRSATSVKGKVEQLV